MSKTWVETERRQVTSQYGAHATHAGLARLHALTGMHTPTRVRATCTHAHSCTHRPKSNTRIAFPRQQWFAIAPQSYVIRTLLLLSLVSLYGYRTCKVSMIWLFYILHNFYVNTFITKVQHDSVPWRLSVVVDVFNMDASLLDVISARDKYVHCSLQLPSV